MTGFRTRFKPRIPRDPALVVTLLAAGLVLVTVTPVIFTMLWPGPISLAETIVTLCGFHLNDGIQMGPPPGGDPAGTIIVVAGAAITLLAFVLAIRATAFPGERNRAHPKYLIFKEDR